MESDEKVFGETKREVMKVQLVAYGIARDILNARRLEFELNMGDSIAQLKIKLTTRYPEFSSLKSLSFAVGDEYREETFVLNDGDEVAIIPPVSGG